MTITSLQIPLVPEAERERRIADYVRRLRWKGPVFTISALAQEGLQPLVEAIWKHVAAHHHEEPLPDVRFDGAPPADHG